MTKVFLSFQHRLSVTAGAAPSNKSLQTLVAIMSEMYSSIKGSNFNPATVPFLLTQPNGPGAFGAVPGILNNIGVFRFVDVNSALPIGYTVEQANVSIFGGARTPSGGGFPNYLTPWVGTSGLNGGTPPPLWNAPPALELVAAQNSPDLSRALFKAPAPIQTGPYGGYLWQMKDPFPSKTRLVTGMCPRISGSAIKVTTQLLDAYKGAMVPFGTGVSFSIAMQNYYEITLETTPQLNGASARVAMYIANQYRDSVLPTEVRTFGFAQTDGYLTSGAGNLVNAQDNAGYILFDDLPTAPTNLTKISSNAVFDVTNDANPSFQCFYDTDVEIAGSDFTPLYSL